MAKRRKTAPSKASLTQHHRAIIIWLQEQGATDVVAIQRNKHIRLQFNWLGEPRFTTLANTPGASRIAEYAARNSLRHMLGLVAANSNVPDQIKEKAS